MRDYQTWFDALYLKHAKKMVNSVYWTLKDWELSRDVVHATFTTLLSKGETMMDFPEIDGWLYKALRNHVGNEIQRAARREELFDPQEKEFGRSDTYFSGEIQFPAGLTEEEESILRLHFVEEWSYEELAAHLGKTESACRTRLCRAKANFKKCWLLEQKNENPGNNRPGLTNIKDRRCKDARRS